MNLPSFGKNQNQAQYYYQAPQPRGSRKKLFLVAGGVIVLLIALVLVLTSGNQPKGQAEMRSGLQATSDALGIIDEYQSELDYAPTQNDVALIGMLLRGNFQSLNQLFEDTYKPKDKFSKTPEPDEASKEALDRAERNNSLESDIIPVLKTKSAEAEQGLQQALPNFSKQGSKESIQQAIHNLQSITDILNKAR